MAFRLAGMETRDSGKQLVWGDLHNHNDIGYGQGSLKRTYEIAKGTGLDVCAYTPHGFWHDLPTDDPKIAEIHHQGFERVCTQWDMVRRKANVENRNGKFTAFVAFEWHSSEFGDYCVLYPGDEGDIMRANSVQELQEHVRRTGAVMIPHHLAYRKGWRGLNWETIAEDVSPVVDGFSEHANSIEAETYWPMILHSMGGAEKSQTVMEQLRHGKMVGLVASTDNHWGHPASYGEGLTAIWATGLTRREILEAIRHRYVYAVTGDRIVLQVRLGDGFMGDILPSSAPRRLRYDVNALGALEYVQIIKNGICMDCHVPAIISSPEDHKFVVRLEFGWDGMTSREVTDWLIRLAVRDGRLLEVVPCFAGGIGSIEKLNRIKSFTEKEAVLEAFTCRLNSRYTSSVVLRLEGTPSTRIELDACCCRKGDSGGCRLNPSIGELLNSTTWGSITPAFSAPKISLGSAHGESATNFALDWTDPHPDEDDFYLVKVQQKNGHIAWSSPIWCTDRKP